MYIKILLYQIYFDSLFKNLWNIFLMRFSYQSDSFFFEVTKLKKDISDWFNRNKEPKLISEDYKEAICRYEEKTLEELSKERK